MLVVMYLGSDDGAGRGQAGAELVQVRQEQVQVETTSRPKMTGRALCERERVNYYCVTDAQPTHTRAHGLGLSTVHNTHRTSSTAHCDVFRSGKAFQPLSTVRRQRLMI